MISDRLPALVFDLDDTLAWQEPLNRRLTEAVARELGWNPGPDWAARFARALEAAWAGNPEGAWCRRLGISAGEALWARFEGSARSTQNLRAWAPEFRRQVWSAAAPRDVSLHTPAVETAAAVYAERRWAAHEDVPGAREVLHQLAPRYRLGLLTNGDSDLQWHKIRAGAYGSLFEVQIVSGDHGVGKPDPALFRLVEEAFAAGPQGRPSGFVMIGNSPASDLAGAAAAGWPALWFRHPEEAAGLHPVCAGAFEDFSQLPALLTRLAGK